MIDDQLASDAIDNQLLALEVSALQNGQALGSGFAYPVTLEGQGHALGRRPALARLPGSPRPRR